MIIETKTPQETFEVGKKIGENAKPGQIYTLTGCLLYTSPSPRD